MQMQSLSVPLVQRSIEVIQSSMNPKMITNYNEDGMDSTLVPTDYATQQSYNLSFHNNNFDNVFRLNETQEENDTDNSSEVSESQSIA